MSENGTRKAANWCTDPGSCSIEEIEAQLRRFSLSEFAEEWVMDYINIECTLRLWMEKVANVEEYAHHPDRVVRCVVAESNRVSVDALLILAEDPSPEVRFRVAKNELSSKDVLKLLYRDPDKRVRGWVANHKNVQEYMLLYLADDSSFDVIACVAKQTKTPEYIIKGLADKYIDIFANTDLYAIKKLPEFWILRALCQNSNTPEHFIKAALKLYNEDLDQAIALNPKASTDILEELSNRYGDHGHIGIAGNPNSSDTALINVARWCEAWVADRILDRPNVSKEVIGFVKLYSGTDWLRAKAEQMLNT